MRFHVWALFKYLVNGVSLNTKTLLALVVNFVKLYSQPRYPFQIVAVF